MIGSWGGKGARRLGLEGVVDKQSFERLCDNLDHRRQAADGPHAGGPNRPLRLYLVGAQRCRCFTP